MQYKTIIHELLQQRPQMHEQLRKSRKLLPTLEQLRQGTEDQPRSLEGNALATEAGQRPEPDRERGPGNGPEGNGGSFALRVLPGRQRGASSSTRQCCSSAVPRRAPEGVTKPADSCLIPSPAISSLGRANPAWGLKRRHGTQPAGPGKRKLGSP